MNVIITKIKTSEIKADNFNFREDNPQILIDVLESGKTISEIKEKYNKNKNKIPKRITYYVNGKKRTTIRLDFVEKEKPKTRMDRQRMYKIMQLCKELVNSDYTIYEEVKPYDDNKNDLPHNENINREEISNTAFSLNVNWNPQIWKNEYDPKFLYDSDNEILETMYGENRAKLIKKNKNKSWLIQ